ncbi:PilZ domain-containing protein [Hahella ganghwensis]|uniref:PilZ domain-containing protein n=1 Tax=Hahella ganghwensis TaxID=286420 RepID=UPI00035EBAC7|nr:PilZ domain-containing protein [Hahella ganghwensis]
MQANETTQTEKRRTRRYPAVELCAYVLRRKAMLISLWDEVQVIDYSHLGMAFEADSELLDKKSLTLSIELKMEVGDIKVDRVNGRIRHTRNLGGLYRYAVEFEKGQDPNLMPQLVRLESLLTRSQNLADRIQKQSQA